MAQVRNDGVLEKRFEQRFPLDLALYKNPLLLLYCQPWFLSGFPYLTNRHRLQENTPCSFVHF
jgi:hypothetical protein